MAVIIDLADAVVARINGATLSRVFTARRYYVPIHQAEDLDRLEVSVVPRELSLAMLSRRDDDFTYTIDVGIQVRIGQGAMTPEEILAATDLYMTLAEEILDLFRGQDLDVGGEQLLCTASGNSPIYHPQHIDEHRVFTSVVSLTFKKARAR